MRNKVTVRNIVDGNLNPAGGEAYGRGIDIRWQDGPLRQTGETVEPNGAFVEDVIEICQRRIEFYQNSKFNCMENGEAIKHLETAREWLASRIKRREAAGVQGTHEGN